MLSVDFVFNDRATTENYTYGHTLSIHDALPIEPALSQIFRQCPVGQGSHPSLAGDQLRNNGCQFGLAQTRRLDIGGVQESREYVQPLPFYRISNQDLVGQL